MTPFDFGVLLADRLLEKQSEGEVHPLQSPAAGYREEMFRQKQVEQQQQQAQQQQMVQQQSANLPQGPTSTNYPNIAPAQQLEPNDLQGGQPAGQPKTAGVAESIGAFARDMYHRGSATAGDLATTYGVDGPVPAAAKGVSMAGGKMKEIMKAIMAKYQKLPVQPASIAGQIAQNAGVEKDAGIGDLMRGGYQFGKGMYAATKPVTGLFTGGMKGMQKGFGTANQLMRVNGKLSIPAMAGAAAATYGAYNTLRSPVEATGDGVKFRSPVRIPAMRFRSPIVWGGGPFAGGVRVQNPVKVLW